MRSHARTPILPDRRIPLSDLDYGPDEEAAVLRVLGSGWLTMGPEVEAFESEFAAYLGVKHSIGVSSGTAALHLAYLALGIGPGDEVIQPAINFVASANMTLAVGATPVFADVIALQEPTISPDEVAGLITDRTRAVVVMHYGGHACRLESIIDICRESGIAVIEDACHAPGAGYRVSSASSPMMLGTLGTVGCFSFFSNKNLAVGEGGMVVTNNDDVGALVRAMRSHGMTSLTWDRHQGHAVGYDVVVPGFNYRLDEIRGALGRVQLAKLDTNNALRRRLVSTYREGLQELPGWTIPFARDDEGADHLMVIVAPDEESRTRVAAGLADNGVQTSAHYPCVPDFEAYTAWRDADVGIARAFAARVLTLPLFPTMSGDDVGTICALIRGLAA
jgi:dTDP-4-amino-4,6-dideoxygalactose transaminase